MIERYVYDHDYFRVQLAYAWKWFLLTQLNEANLMSILEKQTGVKKAFTLIDKTKGDDVWSRLSRDAPRYLEDWEAFSIIVYREYLKLLSEEPLQNELTEEKKDFCVKVTKNVVYNTLQTHFIPSVIDGSSALSRKNRVKRFNQFQQVFANLKNGYNEEEVIIGISWLYNIESYNWIYPANQHRFTSEGVELIPDQVNIPIGVRMFPKEDSRYQSELGAAKLASWAIWGQFLNNKFQTKIEYTQQFLKNVSQANTFETLFDSFPLPVRYYSATLSQWLINLSQRSGDSL